MQIEKWGAVLIQAPFTIQPPVEPPVVEPLSEVFATVTGTSMGLNVDGDTIIKLKTLQDGGATTLNGSVDLTATPLIGATIIPVKNDKSEVTSFSTLAVPNNATNTVTFTTPVSPNVNYICGLVTERRTSNISTTGGDFTVPSAANVYIYDERSSSSSNRVTIGGITDFDANIATPTDVMNGYAMTVGSTFYESMGDQIAKIYAIAREYNGKVIDVALYIFF